MKRRIRPIGNTPHKAMLEWVYVNIIDMTTIVVLVAYVRIPMKPAT
jgi:hypothetical protein